LLVLFLVIFFFQDQFKSSVIESDSTI